MPGVPADVGLGTFLVFARTSWVAEVTEVRWTGVQRAHLDTSHLLTPVDVGPNQFANRTFRPQKLTDPGQLVLNVHFNPNGQKVPLDEQEETIEVHFPREENDATAAVWSAKGFMTGMDITIQVEQLMVATITIKLSGHVTMVEALPL